MRAILVTALVAAFAAGPAAAGGRQFPIDVEQELNGLDIVVKATPGPMVVVTLQNRSPDRADCVATFEGGLATPVRRAAKVAPGKTATLSYSVKDDIARLKVALNCRKA
jgi:hypothetical protein